LHHGIGEATPLKKLFAQFAPVNATPIPDVDTLKRVLLNRYPILSPQVLIVISPINHFNTDIIFNTI
jgi:hypothetical protein